MKYILSYGGGVNSSALFFHLFASDRPLDLVIFADTGEESAETYDAVKRLRRICSPRGIEFVTVMSELGPLLPYFRKMKAVPSLMKRDCTVKFKIRPIRKYLRERYGKKEEFVMYIGIAFDEVHRMRSSDVQYIANDYPFCDDRIDRAGNYEILKRNGFTAEKSGCRGCLLQSRAEWIRLFSEDPGEFDRWVQLEENGSRFPEILIHKSGLRKLRTAIIEQTVLSDFGDPGDEDVGPCAVAGSCFL